MKIYRTEKGSVINIGNDFYYQENTNWDLLLNQDDLHFSIKSQLNNSRKMAETEFNGMKILPPIVNQEIWAAGVTYLRSRDARMEESKDAGGGNFYDKVYVADRPELFFKATAHRVVGTRDFVRIRKDSAWNVPEPELTLFITSSGKIAGYTIGNDMSSRSIEGENPLYLPQAKVYDGSAALGPCVYIPENGLPAETKITIDITRKKEIVFHGAISIRQMKRKHQELVDYLFRECSFPCGCFLMTGTGVVPPNEFTLQQNDEIAISIDDIGTLVNIVQ